MKAKSCLVVLEKLKIFLFSFFGFFLQHGNMEHGGTRNFFITVLFMWDSDYEHENHESPMNFPFRFVFYSDQHQQWQETIIQLLILIPRLSDQDIQEDGIQNIGQHEIHVAEAWSSVRPVTREFVLAPTVRSAKVHRIYGWEGERKREELHPKPWESGNTRAEEAIWIGSQSNLQRWAE